MVNRLFGMVIQKLRQEFPITKNIFTADLG